MQLESFPELPFPIVGASPAIRRTTPPQVRRAPGEDLDINGRKPAVVGPDIPNEMDNARAHFDPANTVNSFV